MLRRLLHTGFTYLQFKMAPIKTFAFLDLETTGLPLYENNTTKITEITVLTVQTKHFLKGRDIPRVHNKLSLCFNPRKLISSDSERLTGLSNLAVEHMAPFSASTVSMLVNFLEHNPKPICLVAHNGNWFDYPILRTEIEKTGCQMPDDILCVDSLDAFRALHDQQQQQQVPKIIPELDPFEFQDGFDEILCKALDDYECSTRGSTSADKGVKRALEVQQTNETTPKQESEDDLGKGRIKDQSYLSKTKKDKLTTANRRKLFRLSFKLSDVFERLTHQKAVDAHQAESDVTMLALSAAALGQSFVDWAEKNSKKFSKVPALKKIGT